MELLMQMFSHLLDRLKHRGLAMITERVNDMDGSVTISNNHPHGICVQNDIADERRCFLSTFC